MAQGRREGGGGGWGKIERSSDCLRAKSRGEVRETEKEEEERETVLA